MQTLVVRDGFVTNWEIVLNSDRLQELLERETKLTVQRLTADIVNIKTSIVERYGPQRAGELKNKVVEVSEHFKDHLQHSRSKKLDFFFNYLLSRKFYTEYFTVLTIYSYLKL